MDKTISIISKNKKTTFEIGKLIGKMLSNGGIILLSGNLGCGKTIIVKGIASFLGIKDAITSPTFDILKSYLISKKKKTFFYHIDAYRLKDNDDISDLEEIINNDNCVVAIEWPEKIKKIIHKPFLEVLIKYGKSVNSREIFFKYYGE